MPKRILTEEQKLKNRQKVKEWARRNPEKKRENSRKAMKKYASKMNPEVRRQRDRQRYREAVKTRSLLTLERIYKSYRNGAKRRNLEFDLSLVDFAKIIESECYYCGNTERMGVDRVDNSKGYTNEAGQCVPCCSWCNVAKHDDTKETFLRKMRNIHARHCMK